MNELYTGYLYMIGVLLRLDMRTHIVRTAKPAWGPGGRSTVPVFPSILRLSLTVTLHLLCLLILH